MTSLVPTDQLGDLRYQRVGEHGPAQTEGGQRHSLDEDLHPQVGHVDLVAAGDVVQQRPEERTDRVLQVDLLEITLVHLDVAGLVGHLLRGVVLVVDRSGSGADLRGCHQGTLLAVHELADRPGVHLGVERSPERAGS